MYIKNPDINIEKNNITPQNKCHQKKICNRYIMLLTFYFIIFKKIYLIIFGLHTSPRNLYKHIQWTKQNKANVTNW